MPKVEFKGGVLRFIPTTVGVTIFAIFALLYLYHRDIYYVTLSFIGIHPWAYPFIDAEFMFAMKRCWRQGVDIYLSVPCDVIPGNKMAYSPLWPRLPFLPTQNAARIPIGLISDLLLLLSVAVLPPAKTLVEAFLISLAVTSTMVCFALERNNIDVWIYLTIISSILIFTRSNSARYFSYILFMAAGLLKYYPFVLFGLALRERTVVFWLIAALSLVGLSIFVEVFWGELARELPNIPTGSAFTDVVGFTNIIRGFLMIREGRVDGPLPGDKFVIIAWQIVGGALMLAWAMRLGCRPGFVAALDQLGESDLVWLVVGCLIMGGCYMLIPNVGYRGIYLLIVLTGLLALKRSCPDPSTRLELSLTATSIVPLMWMEGIRNWASMLIDSATTSPYIRTGVWVWFWMLREFMWLALAHVMLAVVFVFATKSAVGAATLGRLRGLGLRSAVSR
jgi:hypothetical protein